MDTLALTLDAVPPGYSGPVETYFDPIRRVYVMAPSSVALAKRCEFAGAMAARDRLKSGMAKGLADLTRSDSTPVVGIAIRPPRRTSLRQSQQHDTDWISEPTCEVLQTRTALDFRSESLAKQADIHTSYPRQQSLEARALDAVPHAPIASVTHAPHAWAGMTGDSSPTAKYEVGTPDMVSRPRVVTPSEGSIDALRDKRQGTANVAIACANPSLTSKGKRKRNKRAAESQEYRDRLARRKSGLPTI